MKSDLQFTKNGAGPHVVLVHGTAPVAWGQLPEALAAHNTVVTYSRRSFPPNNDLAAPATLRDHADDLVDICEELAQPAIIVGWSIGGVIALDVAVHRPELVARIVVLEAPLHAKKRPTRPSCVQSSAAG